MRSTYCTKLKPWFPKPMKGLLKIHFNQCWLWTFYVQLLRLEWEIALGFWNMGNLVFRRKNMYELPPWVSLFNIWRKGCTWKCHVLPPLKTFNQSNSPMSGKLVWSTRCEHLNSWATPQILMPNCANHRRFTTLQLEHTNCPTFFTTCMQITR